MQDNHSGRAAVEVHTFLLFVGEDECVAFPQEIRARPGSWIRFYAVDAQSTVDFTEGPFERLTEKPIQGGMESDETLRYEFIDDTIAEGAIYYYYVESISLDNRRARFTPIQPSKRKYRAP